MEPSVAARSSRRAVLTAAFGAGIAAIASALGRPAPTEAANGDPMTVGGSFTATGPTTIHAASAIAYNGTSDTGTGIAALSTTGVGLYARSQNLPGSTAFQGKIGVRAESFHDGTSIGVLAMSTGVDLSAGYSGRLLQKPQATAGAPTSGTFAAGESVRDAAGDMWLCTAAGTPGTWHKVRLQPVLGSYAPGTVTRISGASRFATAAAVSAATFAPGVPVAYIAYAFNFPDALAGAAAAGTVPGPVLLADTHLPINSFTTAELTRLKPKRIIVLGSAGVISEAVKAALAPYAVGG